MSNEFEGKLLNKAAYVEDILKKYLPKEEGYISRVTEAMNYSLLAGGKRLRPVMMLEAYRLFAKDNSDESEVEPFVAAIEMIHTYSLVHDDLPAMDNDEYRRGRKTTHAVYGAGMATLAGDGLLNYAFETAIDGAIAGKDEKFLRALKVLSAKAGIYGMIGGQVVDVEYEKNQLDITEEKINFIYDLKTGAHI